MTVTGVILCGGKGKRLRPLTYYFQKVMIPIGAREKPLLEYIVRLFKWHGISNLVFLVGYKKNQIVNYFEDGSRFGVKITYVEDDPRLRGTGGALLNAYLKGCLDSEHLLIYYGDILSNIDLKDLLSLHIKEQADATVALSKGYRVRVGVAEVKDGRILKLVEKPRLDILATIGVLALRTQVLEEYAERAHMITELDIMGDIIPKLINDGRKVIPYITNAFWYDVGSIERYEKLENHVIEEALGFLFNLNSEKQE